MDPALRWTRAHVPTLHGRRVLITGANSGIGYETARLLADRGAAVTLACRNLRRGRDALGRLRSAVTAADVDLLQLDLADLSSVHTAAQAWLGDHDRLDVLVNNAGLMATPLHRTADGFELQLGVNHLGHFALTGLLFDALGGPAPRVVTVASGAHRMGAMAFDDLNWVHRRYRPWQAYGQSKLANLLFAFELQRRSASSGLAVEALAAHPGWAATELQGRAARMRGNTVGARMAELSNRLLAQDAAQGALPTIVAAASSDARGGDYWGPGGRFEVRGTPVRASVGPGATDLRAAGMLWDRSEQLTGVTFTSLRGAGP
jgi:NAD(P)-dependent dehydrogenase (short-subunit alcohol dehydrogenase family)